MNSQSDQVSKVKYQIMVIDPPWPHGRGRPMGGEDKEMDYSLLSLGEIGDLLDREVLPMLAHPANVFVWCFERSLWEAEQMFESRGFKRHIRMIWTKNNGASPSDTIRYSHEFVIWFYRPPLGLRPPANVANRQLSWFPGKMRAHSQKPHEFYAILDKLFPDTTKIDVFSREKREGWDQFGDQTDKFAT